MAGNGNDSDELMGSSADAFLDGMAEGAKGCIGGAIQGFARAGSAGVVPGCLEGALGSTGLYALEGAAPLFREAVDAAAPLVHDAAEALEEAAAALDEAIPDDLGWRARADETFQMGRP